MITISKQEWMFVAMVGCLVVIIAFTPIIIGYLVNPPGKVFLASSSINFFDHQIYFSKIEQVKAGNWLFENLYTSEAQGIKIFNPFWLIIGLFAKLLSLSAPVAFHVTRFLLTIPFLVTGYYFTAFFFEDVWRRRICFIFLVFASGWGWTNILGGQLARARFFDLSFPDAFSFFSIYFSPNSIASLLLMMLIFLVTTMAIRQYQLKYSIWAGVLALILFLFHPYHIPTVFGVLVIFIFIDTIRNKEVNKNYVIHTAILSLFSLPAVMYYAYIVSKISVVYEHFLQNITLTPAFYIVLVSYGVLIPLAIIGVAVLYNKEKLTNVQLFLVTWFFAHFILIYLPINTNIRLAQGWNFVMAIFITYALTSSESKVFLGRFWTKDASRYMITAASTTGLSLLFGFLCFNSSIMVIINDLAFYADPQSIAHISQEEHQAMRWLREAPQDSIILSSFNNGAVIPVFSLKKVFIGHSHETAQFDKKYVMAGSFFSASNNVNREIFLKENHIKYVFFAPKERALANFNPDTDQFLTKVYQNASVSIYQVQ